MLFRNPILPSFIRFSPAWINAPQVPSMNIIKNRSGGLTPSRIQIDVRITSGNEEKCEKLAERFMLSARSGMQAPQQPDLMRQEVVYEMGKLPNQVTVDEPVPTKAGF
jgi:hypothetical protein